MTLGASARMASAQSAPASAGLPAVPAEAAAEPLVHVRVRAPTEVALWRERSGEPWQRVCAAPCEADLSLWDDYRIDSGKAFHLTGSAGQTITVTVRPPSKGGQVAGAVVATAGGVAFWTGFVIGYGTLASSMLGCLPASVVAEGDTFHNEWGLPTCSSVNNSLKLAGITMAAGAVVAGIGALIAFKSTGTDVDQGDESAGRPSESPYSPRPMWREDAQPAAASPGVGLTIPLFSRSF